MPDGFVVEVGGGFDVTLHPIAIGRRRIAEELAELLRCGLFLNAITVPHEGAVKGCSSVPLAQPWRIPRGTALASGVAKALEIQGQARACIPA